MDNIEFEEENAYRAQQQQQMYMKKNRSFFSFPVLNKKIGHYKTGTYILFIMSCLFIVISVFLVVKILVDNRTIPYSELPQTIKNKFPLPVQRLYQEKI